MLINIEVFFFRVGIKMFKVSFKYFLNIVLFYFVSIFVEVGLFIFFKV